MYPCEVYSLGRQSSLCFCEDTDVEAGPSTVDCHLPLFCVFHRTDRCGEEFTVESLILAQNERWRHGLGMQVEREIRLRADSRAANG